MFEKDYEIKFYEVDYKNKLKESVLLNFLQDIAAVHAEMLGFGYSFIAPKCLGWFLLKYHLKIYNWPQNIEKITIKTWPKKIQKLSCLRDFEIYAPNGDKIALVSSSWVLTDFNTRKIVVPSKVLNEFPYLEKDVFQTNFAKIPEVQKIDFEKTYDVRYDDIDINQHVNNANYLTWALEVLGFEFRANHTISELEINYKKELKYGNQVLSIAEYIEDDKTTLHTLKNKNTGDIICSLRIIWE
ncbi:MAG: thioesterase [Candidatus Gastranaerophilales bacterium]|nr:thioesterase [Candidatus Gastranaerophilales bacterium]